MQHAVGVDIGGTKCAVVLGSCGNEVSVIDRTAFPTETQKGPEYAIDTLFHSVEAILDRNRIAREDVQSIGICCGGPLDSRNGIILSPPNLRGWINIAIVELFEKRFGIRTVLQNDANACALAEWKFGAARGCRNVVFLTFGTGMGAGLILNGRLYSGTNDMAGEIGHIRLEQTGPVGYGKAGSFEGFCSGGGLAQLARIKVLERFQQGEPVFFCESLESLNLLNAKNVGDAAEAGDTLAREIYGICGSYLGQGLSILIDMLNPEMIVIGSIFSRSRDLLWPAARKVLERECLAYSLNACRIVPASLGEKTGDYAALAVALGC